MTAGLIFIFVLALAGLAGVVGFLLGVGLTGVDEVDDMVPVDQAFNAEADRAIRLPLSAPDWLPEYERAWATFLKSEPGKALHQRLLAVHAEVSARACADQFHTLHSAGTANGWNECRQWLESLSRSSRVTDEQERQPTTNDDDMQTAGRAGLYEQFAP